MLSDISTALAWPVMAARTLPTEVSDLEQSPTSTWLRIQRTQTDPIGRAMQVSGYAAKSQQPTVMIVGGLAPDRLKLRDILVKSGYSFVDGGNTGLDVHSGFIASKHLPHTKLEEVIAVLGFDSTWQTRAVLTDEPTADVVVTLGSDFISPT